MKYEIGVTKSGLLKRIYNEVKTVIKTWYFCKKNNIDFNEWCAIYEDGTNNIVANFGPSSLGESRALEFFNAVSGDTK